MNTMHCDTPVRRNGEFLQPYKVRDALNHFIPITEVRIRGCLEVHPTFNCRFMATGRTYTYRLMHNSTHRSAFDEGRAAVADVPKNLSLNIEAMNDAAQILVGTHDFSSFRASGCQASQPVRTVYSLSVTREQTEFSSISDGEMAHITIYAKGFLYRQVRNIVGALVMVGSDRWSAADLRKVLDAKDRSRYKYVTAKPEGLYLTHVHYPFGCTVEEMVSRRDEIKEWSFDDVPPWERDAELDSEDDETLTPPGSAEAK
ncbi:hypothetical protein SARC_02405 [Sphaeroforma arctica JP610]|uniref:tRNA pseudouridine synthase n=1 Tax=Sphaeroforma arctica JP610 TaxID=667725 RepID=A0A0L0G950_9EUKA|nr:hypothetical protein SARC_02405 [Sphaeroforma arctica JP610]KNC85406.1 hypothetical protein SARC_02405 [Sphaeroforma arctica JP610]|eukprot:XP_014159308.1 hypothetical protein SARC_02405 [Sphaeroforma arctica JP610]